MSAPPGSASWSEAPQDRRPERAGPATAWPFAAVLALAGGSAAAATLAWTSSMAGGMPMPGGWTMSMAWMRMPGQTWPAAAAAFAAMWSVMMVPMMMASLGPVLWEVHASGARRLAAVRVAAGYFLVWAGAGVLVYPLGAAVAAAEMRWAFAARAVPAATGLVLLVAGLVQLTRWKARELSRCRPGVACAVRDSPRADPFRSGILVGLHCCQCCAGLMAVQLALGVMDLGAMAAVALAITAERLAPRPEPVARATGVALVAAGALLFARAVS